MDIRSQSVWLNQTLLQLQLQLQLLRSDGYSEASSHQCNEGAVEGLIVLNQTGSQENR